MLHTFLESSGEIRGFFVLYPPAIGERTEERKQKDSISESPR